MSIIPSLGTDSERLLLSEVHEVENLQERIEEIAERIASHPTIEHVTAMSNRDLEDPRIVDAVISNSHIRCFGFYQCEIDSRILIRILRMPSLDKLQMSFCHFQDAEAAGRAIQCNGRKLKEFVCTGMRDNGHGNVVISALARSLRFRSSLTRLEIRGCHLGQESLCAIADASQGHSSLEEVSISDRELELSGDTANAFALAIEHNTSMQELSLDVGTIPPVGSQRMLESLTRNQTLACVEIKGVTSNDVEAQQQATSAPIGNNYSLERLTLGASKIAGEIPEGGASGAAAKGMVGPLLLYLNAFNVLETISLTAWDFNTDGFEAVCNKLQQNESVRKLHLSNTRFDSEKAGILSRFFANSSANLTGLHLFDCTFDDEDAAALCESLKRNESLRELEFFYNKMGNRILMHLAGLVESNNSLEELSFWDDRTLTSNEGMVRFGEALKRNTALKTLSWIAIHRASTESHFHPLLDALKHHRKLQLKLYGSSELSTELQKEELALYNARNAHLCPLLSADPPLPLGLWPKALHRAGTSQASQTTNLNMLHFLVKEKCELFQRARGGDNIKGKVTASKRKRTQDAAGARRRSKRGRS